MSNAINLCLNEGVINLAACLAAAVWSWVKGAEWYRTLRDAKIQKVERIVEAGVEQTWREIVQEMKSLSPDGKLTPAQQREVQDFAIARAKEIGLRMGVDIAREYGPELLRLAVDRVVRRLKGRK